MRCHTDIHSKCPAEGHLEWACSSDPQTGQHHSLTHRQQRMWKAQRFAWGYGMLGGTQISYILVKVSFHTLWKVFFSIKMTIPSLIQLKANEIYVCHLWEAIWRARFIALEMKLLLKVMRSISISSQQVWLPHRGRAAWRNVMPLENERGNKGREEERQCVV